MCQGYASKAEDAYSAWEEASLATAMADEAFEAAVHANAAAAAVMVLGVAGIAAASVSAVATGGLTAGAVAAFVTWEAAATAAAVAAAHALEIARLGQQKASIAENRSVDALYKAIDAWCDCVAHQKSPRTTEPPPPLSEIQARVEGAEQATADANEAVTEAEGATGEAEDAVSEAEDAKEDFEDELEDGVEFSDEEAGVINVSDAGPSDEELYG